MTCDLGRRHWGAKVSGTFKIKVFSIAKTLGADPNHLMAAMAFESGESFSASAVNKASGAVGLIQFTSATAVKLGTTVAALKAMTAIKQLDYVLKYFTPYKGMIKTIEDLYMAILWPAAVGKLGTYVLFKKGTTAYTQNAGLDVNKDGSVTKTEAASFVKAKLTKGLGVGFSG